jgi:hypothetical protein
MKQSIFYVKTIAIIVLLFFSYSLFSQKDTTQYYNRTLINNNFSFELGGKGFLYSIGYERLFCKKKKILIVGGIGITYAPPIGFDGVLIPIEIKVALGKKQNKLQFGLFETNGFDFTPYPKTRAERVDYRNSGTYKYDYYSPPYQLFFLGPSLGYKRYFKNRNSLSFEFVYLLFNNYGHFKLTNGNAIPWLGISYNVNF